MEEDVPHINWGHYLNFLCMNPGVVFRPIADVVRSIVLTSGTLAPLVTFNSELGTNFTNEMQALHIIDENQVCHHLYSYTETCEVCSSHDSEY